MRRATVVMVMLGLGACTKSTSSTSAPPSGAATAPTATLPPSGVATAPAAPTDADKLTFADGSPERQVQTFCIDNYKKLGACFEEQPFWDILATIFFAQNPSMDDGTPRARSLWIGMRKDDFAGLMREKRVPADCEASIRHSRWPSAATIDRVTKARAATCPAFANAFGTMLFVEGAFSQPR